MSIDPLVTDAHTGSSFNRYSYADNNTYANVDPDGRQSIRIVGQRVTQDPFYSPVQASKGDPVARKIVQIYNKVAAPQPSGPEDDKDKEKDGDEFKRPNDRLEKGDKIDRARFDRRVKVEGETRFQDQKSGYQISPDRAVANSHGGSAFKLINRAGERIATLSSEGVVLRIP